jgi:shikimate 5-dehydrogenase
MNSSTLTSDLYCVMGNPVAHSRSPAIHARFAELAGQQLRYERRLIALDGFAQGVRDFIAEGGRGCNITVPFKFEAPALASVCSERVRLAGAANVLSFAADGSIHADNTDGLGLVADITRNAGVPLQGARVLLVARTQDKLERVAEGIRQAGGWAAVYPADLSKPAEAAARWAVADAMVPGASPLRVAHPDKRMRALNEVAKRTARIAPSGNPPSRLAMLGD